MLKLFQLLLLLSLVSSKVLSAEATTRNAENEAFFAWVEYSYPQIFSPANSQSRLISGYYVRYYSDTNSFLGIRGDEVYAHGSAFSQFESIGKGIRILGAFDNFSNDFNQGGFVANRQADLIINEVVAIDSNDGPDWFELFVAGRQPVSLGDYKVKDGKNDRELTPLPDITLNPGEYLRITASEEDEGFDFRVPFKLGSNDKVQLYLDDVLVDELNWDSGQAPEGFSFARNPENLSQTQIQLPTPNAQNQLAESDEIPDYSLGAVGSMLSSTVHEISLDLDTTAFEVMVNSYVISGKKNWLETNITIDGTAYQQAGVRLKGSSSLRNISTSDDPATLPWLVKMDKFISGQDHQGLEEFVIRSNRTKTSLNEAVALELLERAGLSSQDAIAISLQANGGDPVLRLAIEHPDDEWMKENFDDSGALYKAESTGDYSYRGDNPQAYDEIFDQEAGKKNADLSPLIEFLQFINQVDDETFKAELFQHLDVDAFVVYLAMQELLNNSDDIDGPGNNAYLYYDTDISQFTIVPWDYNLAFGTLIRRGEFTGITIPGSDETFPVGDNNTPDDSSAEEIEESENPLVRRFLADEEWRKLFQQKQTELRATLFESGIATDILESWRLLISSTGLLAQEDIDTDAEKVKQHFE